jgi:hypothetical protein
LDILVVEGGGFSGEPYKLAAEELSSGAASERGSERARLIIRE